MTNIIEIYPVAGKQQPTIYSTMLMDIHKAVDCVIDEPLNFESIKWAIGFFEANTCLNICFELLPKAVDRMVAHGAIIDSDGFISIDEIKRIAYRELTHIGELTGSVTELELCKIYRKLDDSEIDKTRPYSETVLVNRATAISEIDHDPSYVIGLNIAEYGVIDPEEINVQLDWNPKKFQENQKNIMILGHEGDRYIAQCGRDASPQDWLTGLRRVERLADLYLDHLQLAEIYLDRGTEDQAS